ncbi:hypothetical protein MRBBS_2331 [Marinobacter sp. BSs20148]|nr:hypothetical protein MRBBS_2331 [Marinobacter sp. BSs20148]
MTNLSPDLSIKKYSFFNSFYGFEKQYNFLRLLCNAFSIP